MSDFVCVTTRYPQRAIAAFQKHFQLIDLSNAPIGRTLAAQRADVTTLFITYGGHCSTNILRPTRQTRHIGPKFLDCLNELSTNTPSVTVLAHWMKGLLTEEELTVLGKVKLTFKEFATIFPRLQYDMRYVIVSDARVSVAK